MFVVVKKETIRGGAICGFARNYRNKSSGREGGAAGIQSKNFITITISNEGLLEWRLFVLLLGEFKGKKVKTVFSCYSNNYSNKK